MAIVRHEGVLPNGIVLAARNWVDSGMFLPAVVAFSLDALRNHHQGRWNVGYFRGICAEKQRRIAASMRDPDSVPSSVELLLKRTNLDGWAYRHRISPGTVVFDVSTCDSIKLVVQGPEADQ